MVLVPRDERPYITFGDVSTYDYECFVDGSKTYNAPERQYEVVEVPGRNGDVHFDNGRYSNVELNFTAYFMDVEEFNDFRDKMVAMIGYQRLEDSHHPDEYRMAVLTGGIEPEVLGEGLTYVQVDLTFTAKPQRFLKSGDNPITFNLTPGVVVDNLLFNNPTQYTSLPLIRVYGTKGGFYCGSGYVNILGGWDSWITIEYI
jgi:phage-related protein